MLNADANAENREKSTKIDETNAQIVKLQDDIKVIQERIQKRNELLKDRARNYQENGGNVKYISVLMGSSSFSNFIDCANAVESIMQADQDILKQAEADKQELERQQAQVKSDLENLQKMLSDLEKLNQQLNSQKAEKERLLDTLQSEEKQVSDNKMSLQKQEQIHAAQDAAVPAPAVSSGPAPGPISSTYGPRWGEFHYGVDIANAGSNVPIVAAADGIVVVSHYSSSYGNVIYIAHSINGQVYTTVYAHMESRIVGEGATVKKGQQIGIMGSTGESTGQHLHFELYRGPWKYHSAINPEGIVPL